MLSQTKGLRHRLFGGHRSDATIAATTCKELIQKGRCAAFAYEQSIRRQLVNKKENELKEAAKELIALEKELLEVDPESSTAAGCSVEQVVATMKKEKAYQDWSLEREVAKHMLLNHRPRCSYSHVTGLSDEEQPLDEAVRSAVEKLLTEGSVGSSWELDDVVRCARRFLVLPSLFQRAAFLVLIAGSIVVPKHVVCDVEALLRKRREAELEAAGVDVEGDIEIPAKDIEAEGKIPVAMKVVHQARGSLNLSSLPSLLQRVASHCESLDCAPLANAVIRVAAVLAKKPSQLKSSPQVDGDRNVIQASQSFSKDLRQFITRKFDAKEVDLGSMQRCQELLEVIKLAGPWMGSSGGEAFVLKQLSLRHCNIVSADAIITGLRKHGLHQSLIGLDLSDNKLDSMRFLFQLRADYGDRLLFLGIKNNPITRKPEYREQVRATLPRLVSLDGVPVRRPPLALPFPKGSPVPSNMGETEYNEICEVIGRFCYTWESRQVPFPPRDLCFGKKTVRRNRPKEGDGVAGDEADEELEDELDETNFCKRYLHQECQFSLSVMAGCHWFDEEIMRESRDVELDKEYDGCRLSALDVKELRVIDVSIRNHSRNLLLGRPALHRIAKGHINCYTAYQSTLYPQRFFVEHHLNAASIQITKLDASYAPAPPIAGSLAAERIQREIESGKAKAKHVPYDPYNPQTKKKAPATGKPSYGPQQAPQVGANEVFFGADKNKKPLTYLVTLHGTMTWRSPTMTDGQCIVAAYDRTLTLAHRPMPTGLPRSERGKYCTIVIINDQVTLRPPPSPSVIVAPVCFSGRDPSRIAYVATEYGLDHNPEGVKLVESVFERCNSDAAVHHLLRSIVFPDCAAPDSFDLPPKDGDDDEGIPLARKETSLVLWREASKAAIFTDDNLRRCREQSVVAVASSITSEDLFDVLDEHSLSSAKENVTSEKNLSQLSLAELDKRLAWCNTFKTSSFGSLSDEMIPTQRSAAATK